VKWVLVVLGTVAVVFGLSIAALVATFSGPIGWKPPEVAPLPRNAQFQAELVLARDDGYVVAGVVGTKEPGRDDRCSGRFALVELDEGGEARRAVIASGPERDRFCADRVEILLADEGGGWLLSGTGQRRSPPSRIYPDPLGTDHAWYTLHFFADGSPVGGFADRGLLEDTLLAGRVGGVLVTQRLQRLTNAGEVRDDLLAEPRDVWESWSAILVDDVVVALGTGLPLDFQTFVVDRSQHPGRFRALHPYPNELYPERTVDLGSGIVNEADTVLHRGRLAVVLDGRSARVVAVDPRRRRLVESFGQLGAVPVLPELVTSAALAVDPRGRLVVAYVTVDHIDGYRIHALRLSAKGSRDPRYGGVVREEGRNAEPDPWVSQVVVGGDGRAVVLDIFQSTLLRLTPAGRLDPAFGRNGVVALADVRVCELPPARHAPACRGR
jgi:hypothetical protein